jgi:hypothetical protein
MKFENLNNLVFEQLEIQKDFVQFVFSGEISPKIKIHKIDIIEISPCDFPCPKGMSVHTQIAWAIDALYPFLEHKIINVKSVEGIALGLEFENGMIAFSINNANIIEFSGF